MSNTSEYFFQLKEPVHGTDLPEKFTFPFQHEPNPLCIAACNEVQNYLAQQKEWIWDFGIVNSTSGQGKMFGVLIVQNLQGEIGYLRAFSGKMAGVNHLPGFVPPVFDMLAEAGFYRIGEEEINVINREIEHLEADPDMLKLIQLLEISSLEAKQDIQQFKERNKEKKLSRKQLRKEEKLSDEALELLNKESVLDHFLLKDLNRKWSVKIDDIQAKLNAHMIVIDQLKQLRREKSNQLQKQLFNQYAFLNQYQEIKTLNDIFNVTEDVYPPSGAGECTAPKLLQYAFKKGLKPIAMAEFWWGKSPVSEIRKHGFYYGACMGKCEPILRHMLKGIDMDEDPCLHNPALGKELTTIYEDEYLLIINKPAEFLTVPGKKITDSVYERMKNRYPKATGPLIVHRLDMSTSGLLIIAKEKGVYQHLQRQFIKRTVKKRYVAILEGNVQNDDGMIDLPLRVDLDDRPRQLVCYEHGKPALTRYKVIDRSDTYTRVNFYPISGRTHQLRVHAAHTLGLNAPIKGDDLYGQRGDRLYLHAEYIAFTHPITMEGMKFEVKADF